jgi:hypothetical protein
VVSALLARFRDDMDRLMEQFRAACHAPDPHERDIRAHAIKSMCHAAGAYVLGDLLDQLAAAAVTDGGKCQAVLETAERTWALTRAHVEVLRIGLEEAAEAGPD